MLLRRIIALWTCLAAAVTAAPQLTTIQDTLYRADGTPFSGFLLIEWNTFQAGDSSNIATQSTTVPVIDGVLRVQLVPTTTATGGAYYTVKYHSNGKVQYQETWAVPQSILPLKLNVVRIAGVGPGGVVVPPALTTVAESDVNGLVDDLAARPVKGPGYTPGRAAFIDGNGAIETVVGSPDDCIRVDGSTGPCGSTAEAMPGYVDGETPAGTINGANAAFTLSGVPNPVASLALYRNGLLEKQGLDYTVSGNAITFLSGAIPQSGDALTASYRMAAGEAAPGQATAFGSAQVLCSSTGSATSVTSLTLLGSCTIAARSLAAGDRVEIRFDYSHEGTAAGIGFEVRWGATAVASRTTAAAEALATGRADAGVHANGAQWSGESWGAGLAFAAGAGSATDSLTAPLTIGFFGRLLAAATDTVTLRNFTVIRYPARQNP
jgi:hypothetical protein